MAVVHLNYPKFRAFDSSNRPLSGGKVNVYAAGTSDPVDTYTDQGAGTPNANPVILDSEGEASIWYNQSIKIVLTDSADVQLWSEDNVQANIEPTVSGVYNLIQNGSFESDTDSDGTPDNWTLAADTNGTIAIDSSAGGSAHGNNGLLFTSGGSGGGSATTTPYQEVLAGKDIQVTFSLKSSAVDNTCIVTVLWYQNNAGLASSTASTTVYTEAAANPTTWTTYSYSATAPADAYYCKIKLSGVDSSGIVTAARNCHFDDIRLYQGPVIFPNVTAPVTASDADLNAVTNFEETVSATTSEVTIATGKTLNIADDSGLKLNEVVVSSTAAELNILDGATLDVNELNTLDGITSTVAELNTLDGFTGDVDSLNNRATDYRGALVYLVANFTTTTATFYQLAFDTEDYDTSAIHDNVTNNSRLTVPTGVTRVRLSGEINYDTDAVGVRNFQILKNGSTIYVGSINKVDGSQGGGGWSTVAAASPILTVTSGDYFELQAHQTSGANLDVIGTAQGTWFAMEIIE